jgi:hypothetical protein
LGFKFPLSNACCQLGKALISTIFILVAQGLQQGACDFLSPGHPSTMFWWSRNI